APGRRRLPSLGLLLAGVVVLLVGDVLHSWSLLHPGGSSGETVRETCRVVFCVLLGAAALHPSAGDLVAPATEASFRPSPRRLGALLVAASLVPVLIAVGV